jgi:ribosome-binding factor A
VRAEFLELFMKREERSHEDFVSFSNEMGPEDGVDPRIFFRKANHRKPQRKALQLCGQIARELSQILAWEMNDEVLGGLTVEAVIPAPNASHLLVVVSTTEPREVGDILERLQAHLGHLRGEVARAIHRKRVPELTFRVLRPIAE